MNENLNPAEQSPADTEPESLPEPDDLRYNLDSLDDYLAVGEKVAGEGRLDEAADVLREAARRYPDSAPAHYNLGVALFLCLKRDKDHNEYWENLADDEEVLEEAIGALENTVAIDPGLVPAYNNLAKLYAIRGRSEDALRTWTKSLELDANQPDVQADIKMYRNQISPKEEDLEERRLLRREEPDIQL